MNTSQSWQHLASSPAHFHVFNVARGSGLGMRLGSIKYQVIFHTTDYADNIATQIAIRAHAITPEQ